MTSLSPHVAPGAGWPSGRAPLRLPPNSIEHWYRGGDRIAALRGGPGGPRHPEEWLGSTVTRFGHDVDGLTTLSPPDAPPRRTTDARLFREIVEGDPHAWLGAAHVERWGHTPGLLVKLLDAGQRLPVHVHPTRAFARRHLDCPYGKSEAWVVVDVPSGGGTVFVGATRAVTTAEWHELVSAQATDDMLALLHPVTVQPGDAVFVPSGTPHAIDADTFVVELQEPTDFSVLLEWEGFAVDGPNDGHLGLGFGVALQTVRTDAVDTATLDRLVRRLDGAASYGTARPALPAAADPYFRAWTVDAAGADVTVPASFSVVVILDGPGTLRTGDHSEAATRGDAFVVPHAAGTLTFDGTVRAVVAQPPDPDSPEPAEWDAIDDGMHVAVPPTPTLDPASSGDGDRAEGGRDA